MLNEPKIIGIILALINFIASVTVVLISIKFKPNELGKIALISFVARYIIIAALIWQFFRQYSKVESFDFGIYFIISSFIFIMIEIFIFHYASNFVNLQTGKKHIKTNGTKKVN